MDTSTMKLAGKKVTPQTPEKALAKGNTAKGAALASVCMAYGLKRMAAEEKEQGKLLMIVKSINDLAREGHAEFRAQLTSELGLLKELREVAGVTRAQTAGYSLSSFEVLVSNWKTISHAVEMGYSTVDKSWGLVLAESVAMKNGATAKSGEMTALPTKRKVGRKATPEIDKAKTAAEKLDDHTFAKFAAWVQTELATRHASATSKAAIKVVEPALV